MDFEYPSQEIWNDDALVCEAEKCPQACKDEATLTESQSWTAGSLDRASGLIHRKLFRRNSRSDQSLGQNKETLIEATRQNRLGCDTKTRLLMTSGFLKSHKNRTTSRKAQTSSLDRKWSRKRNGKMKMAPSLREFFMRRVSPGRRSRRDDEDEVKSKSTNALCELDSSKTDCVDEQTFGGGPTSSSSSTLTRTEMAQHSFPRSKSLEMGELPPSRSNGDSFAGKQVPSKPQPPAHERVISPHSRPQTHFKRFDVLAPKPKRSEVRGRRAISVMAQPEPRGAASPPTLTKVNFVTSEHRESGCKIVPPRDKIWTMQESVGTSLENGSEVQLHFLEDEADESSDHEPLLGGHKRSSIPRSLSSPLSGIGGLFHYKASKNSFGEGPRASSSFYGLARADYDDEYNGLDLQTVGQRPTAGEERGKRTRKEGHQRTRRKPCLSSVREEPSPGRKYCYYDSTGPLRGRPSSDVCDGQARIEPVTSRAEPEGVGRRTNRDCIHAKGTGNFRIPRSLSCQTGFISRFRPKGSATGLTHSMSSPALKRKKATGSPSLSVSSKIDSETIPLLELQEQGGRRHSDEKSEMGPLMTDRTSVQSVCATNEAVTSSPASSSASGGGGNNNPETAASALMFNRMFCERTTSLSSSTSSSTVSPLHVVSLTMPATSEAVNRGRGLYSSASLTIGSPPMITSSTGRYSRLTGKTMDDTRPSSINFVSSPPSHASSSSACPHKVSVDVKEEDAMVVVGEEDFHYHQSQQVTQQQVGNNLQCSMEKEEEAHSTQMVLSPPRKPSSSQNSRDLAEAGNSNEIFVMGEEEESVQVSNPKSRRLLKRQTTLRNEEEVINCAPPDRTMMIPLRKVEVTVDRGQEPRGIVADVSSPSQDDGFFSQTGGERSDSPDDIDVEEGRNLLTPLPSSSVGGGSKPLPPSCLPLRPSNLATMPLKRALTLPHGADPMLRSPMRRGPARFEETDSSPKTELSIPTLEIPIRPPMLRAESVDTSLVIPTFTVTINPLEDDEITFVPESPTTQIVKTLSDKVDAGMMANHVSNNRSNSEDSSNNNNLITKLEEDEEMRRCSIGSAGSLVMDNRLCVPDLSIRRVSEISHINEMRRECSGMEHINSEHYEISRENPDNISLDSIHKTVFKRCQNKYIPPQRSSTQNKCFVLVTTGFTILGIVYGFWYKNFGPGADDDHH